MAASVILKSLRHWSDVQPEVAALVHEGKTASFRELHTLTEQFAESVLSRNLPIGAVIAVEAVKAIETIALIAALEHLGYPVLLIAANMGPEVKQAIYGTAAVEAEIACCRGDLVVRLSSQFDGSEASCPSGAALPMFLLTTSGSTGIPKVVKLPRDGVRSFFAWSQTYFAIGPGKTVLSYAPLNFDLSLLEVWGALDGGATVILVDAARAADGNSLRTLVQAHRPHLLQGVPLLFQLLLDKPISSLEAVTDVIVTGEATPRPLRQSMTLAFPNARFHNIYGATETNDSFILSIDSEGFASIETLPIGQPVASTLYKIVDDQGIVIETAGIGELHTSTPFAALGYTDENLTGQSFYADGDHIFYRTGDLAERDALGGIRVLGRRDFVVKVRGVRTNLRDVEIAIEKHPSVKTAVVCPVQDDAGNVVLHAVIQLGPDRAASSLILRQHCAETLPRSAIPSRFTVDVDPLPRTSTGKPDRNAIRRNLEKEMVFEHA